MAAQEPAAALPATLPPSTPSSRRPNVPAPVKEWIFSKANLFQYYDEVRTKEEKQIFITELTKKLNSRFGNETGEWDEIRTGNMVRNLKKEKFITPRKEVPQPEPTPPSPTPIERLLLDWQATLIASSRLNSNTLSRHSSNRGSCNEDLVKGFLSSVLSSKWIGIGSGEILSNQANPRQVDILIYNQEYPCLMPARFSNVGTSCACYYPESVMTIIEVKTTLTNQDLQDVAKAASLLFPIPLIIFAFDSQVSLKAIDLSILPANVEGIVTLSHGSLVREKETWHIIHPSKRAPLIAFYLVLLRVLLFYAEQNSMISLTHVLSVLKGHLPAEEEKEGELHNIENAVFEMNLK